MTRTNTPVIASNSANAKRIAAIDWMRGFVMLLMVVDHVSMAYNASHLSSDSAARLRIFRALAKPYLRANLCLPRRYRTGD